MADRRRGQIRGAKRFTPRISIDRQAVGKQPASTHDWLLKK